MVLLIKRIGILGISCEICLRFILYNSCISYSSFLPYVKSDVCYLVILALVVPCSLAGELNVLQYWSSEIFRVLSELVSNIHCDLDVTGVLDVDFVFNFILCEEAVLVSGRRSLGSTDLVHLVLRVQFLPGYSLAFVIDLFVSCGYMSFTVEYLLEHYCVLAVEAGCIECECDFYLAAAHECLEFLLSSDLLSVHVEYRLACSLVHQDSLGCIGLTLLEVLILDNVNKCDLLLRSDVPVLSVNRSCSSDLRDIISDGLKINESVLALLIYCEVELLKDISLVMLAWHLLKDI